MRRALVGALLAAAWCAAATPALAQREFQFFAQFSDAAGRAVTTLTEADIQVAEDGTNGKVLKLEPVDWPVRVAILLDNGTGSADRIVNVRQGAKGLIEALPAGVEISLQTLAPQPRWLVRPTTDKQALLEGVDRYSPDSSASRFVDGLIETVARFDKEKGNNFPVVVILGSLTAGWQLDSRSGREAAVRALSLSCDHGSCDSCRRQHGFDRNQRGQCISDRPRGHEADRRPLRVHRRGHAPGDPAARDRHPDRPEPCAPERAIPRDLRRAPRARPAKWATSACPPAAASPSSCPWTGVCLRGTGAELWMEVGGWCLILIKLPDAQRAHHPARVRQCLRDGGRGPGRE